MSHQLSQHNRVSPASAPITPPHQGQRPPAPSCAGKRLLLAAWVGRVLWGGRVHTGRYKKLLCSFSRTLVVPLQ